MNADDTFSNTIVMSKGKLDNSLLAEVPQESKQSSNKKTYLIIGGVVAVLAILGVIFGSVYVTQWKKKPEISAKLETIPLPEGAKLDTAHFLPTGRIIFFFKKENDTKLYLGVMDHDGKNFKQLWGDEYKQIYKSNGYRLMPFTDNKRILVGDHVFECTPSIDECNECKLIPIIYPSKLVNDTNVFILWSEIVISQDSKYIAWSTLNMKFGATNFIGKLTRKETEYVIENSKVISALTFVKDDPDKPGFLIPQTIRGGEIKQFVRGGAGLTLAGATSQGLARSVFQDLKTDAVAGLNSEPGYEETTILSPDEHLGITMSTRFSNTTNFAILGIVPRPYSANIVSGLNRYVYDFAVSQVRSKRPGNIGPVLSDIARSSSDPTYHGVDLHDPEDKWVYCSPMSWHKDGLKAMWVEVERSTKNLRLRAAKVQNYYPSKAVKTVETPENIPYALDFEEFFNTTVPTIDGKISGKHSGDLRMEKSQTRYASTYNHYSDDGKIFFDGTEVFQNELEKGGARYTANVTVSGTEEGRMDLRIVFSKENLLVWDVNPDDGKPETYGFATYGDKTINVTVYK